MSQIGVVFFSKCGATKAVAHALAEGVEALSQSVIMIEVLPSEIVEGRYINEQKLKQLGECDAIVFGSPTYMGSPAAQFKAFMDASSEPYCAKVWRNKFAAGFTTGGSLNGEQQQTLLSFFTLACQHGMLWIGLDASKHTDDLGLNRTGSNIGLVSSIDDGQESVNANDLLTAHYYGSRIATLVQELTSKE